MKLLLDENLSKRLVPFLQHDFPGSTQVALLGMESASDKDVWQRAKDDGYVWGSPPQVVRLRTPNQTRAAVLKLLLDNKEVIVSSLVIEARASIELIT